MRNYKQTDIETKEETIKKIDVLAVIVALAGVTVLIWGLI